MDRAPSMASISSTPPTSTAAARARAGRSDHRELVRAGRRTARQGRPRHQGVRADDRLAERGRLSALHIRRACDDSLRRLQTDHIDLYQFHHVDAARRGTKCGRRWRSSSAGQGHLRRERQFAGWHIAQANEAARRRGTSWASCASRASTIWWTARWSSRSSLLPCLRPRLHSVVPAGRRSSAAH